MKTLIWKELRENGKWALLALAGLLVAEIFVLSSGRDSNGFRTTGTTLCSNTFLLVSTFGCAVIGAALGALQILPERRRDQWASLLHRPVSRQTIFLGKVVAGLSLYGLATILPLLASVIFTAWPGQFPAPFLPRMTIPAASDILLGTVFYFAALLLGMMPSGKWIGTRGAIGMGVVGVLLLHLEGKWPFLLPLGASLVLAMAAAGAIHGSTRQRPWPGRLAFGMVVLAGTAIAALLTGLLLRAIPSPRMNFIFTSTVSITKEGDVYRTTYHGPGQPPEVRDLEGNLVTNDERFTGNRAYENFLQTESFVNREMVGQSKDLRSYFQTARTSEKYLESIPGSYDGPEIWYRIPGDGRSYFVGYDKLSRRRIGICDAEGFKDAQATPLPFASEPEGEWNQAASLLYRLGKKELLTVDFAERRMTKLFDAGNHDTLHGAVRFPRMAEAQRIAVALENSIRILDTDGGQPLLTLPYGHDPNTWTSISITATASFSRTFLEYTLPYFAPRKKGPDEEPPYLDVIDAQGQRIATLAIPVVTAPTLPPHILVRVAGLLDLPIPTFLATLAAKDQRAIYLSVPKFRLARAWERSVLVPVFVMALLLCGVAVFWARRIGLTARQTGIWVGLTFTFGVAGFVGYRLAADWPTRVRCPQCGRGRAISAGTCPHCQEAWAGPASNGAEIFEAVG